MDKLFLCWVFIDICLSLFIAIFLLIGKIVASENCEELYLWTDDDDWRHLQEEYPVLIAHEFHTFHSNRQQIVLRQRNPLRKNSILNIDCVSPTIHIDYRIVLYCTSAIKLCFKTNECEMHGPQPNVINVLFLSEIVFNAKGKSYCKMKISCEIHTCIWHR